MVKNKAFFITVVSMVFFSSCDLFNNEQEKLPGELIPLAVGNYWEYEFNYIFKDTIRYEVTAEVEVPIGDTTYTAYAANFLPFPPDLVPYYWLRRNGEEGLYIMGGISEVDTLFINELEHKLPSEVGETIETPQISFSPERLEFYISDTLSITLIDDNRQIETPAGKFDCYVYKFTVSHGEDVLRGWDYYMYYSQGIGLVAQIAVTEGEQENIPENIIEEMYLINFKVK